MTRTLARTNFRSTILVAAVTIAFVPLFVGAGPARQDALDLPVDRPTSDSPTSDPNSSAIPDDEIELRVAKLSREGLTTLQTMALLEDLCTTAPHRLSGSPGAAAAVEWARQTMVDLGFENVRLEPVMVPHWERGDICTLRFAEPGSATPEPLPAITLGGSEPTPVGGVTAEVIVVRSFDELAERKDEAVGKIVLFDRPMLVTEASTFDAYGAAVPYRSRSASEAGKAGAVAAITRSMTTRRDDIPHTGGMYYQPGVPRIPTAAVSTLGAERIVQHIERGEKVVLHFEQNCRWREDAPSANVVGEIVGSEKPDEIVVVGGHLDGWDIGQGAHDDGSGSCHSLNALSLLRRVEIQPKRTIRCVLFMNEENGLRGARQYVEDHRDEMERTVFALESDRGGFTPRGFTTNASGRTRALIERVGRALVNVGADRIVSGGGGADVNPMTEFGVPVAGYLPDPHRYFDLHHSARDTLAAVNERELELGAIAIASLISVIADAEVLDRNSP